MENANLVKWVDAYSVGIPVIDKQHKELVKMTNDLFLGCERTELTVVYFMKAIQKAVNYSKIHFATEEKYMLKVNYPEYEAHKKEHTAFVTEVLNQIKLFEQGKTAPLSFALFLKNWLLNHIAISDKKYSSYLIPIADQIVSTEIG
ncbi:MAG: bacteriohemerythrin [Treponema sp.]|jgi:hemerythrin|nr:bacteriohemerythrin [Treponema sp.]